MALYSPTDSRWCLVHFPLTSCSGVHVNLSRTRYVDKPTSLAWLTNHQLPDLPKPKLALDAHKSLPFTHSGVSPRFIQLSRITPKRPTSAAISNQRQCLVEVAVGGCGLFKSYNFPPLFAIVFFPSLLISPTHFSLSLLPGVANAACGSHASVKTLLLATLPQQRQALASPGNEKARTASRIGNICCLKEAKRERFQRTTCIQLQGDIHVVGCPLSDSKYSQFNLLCRTKNTMGHRARKIIFFPDCFVRAKITCKI